MRATHTSTYVWVHAWAETDTVARDHPGLPGQPRHGDPCSMPGCSERLREGERVVAVVEIERDDRAVPERGEAWIGYEHPTHRTWYDGAPTS